MERMKINFRLTFFYIYIVSALSISISAFADTPDVIVIGIDDATVEWMKNNKIHNLSELSAKIQEQLELMNPGPIVIVWDMTLSSLKEKNLEVINHNGEWVSFEHPATNNLARLLRDSKTPIVLPVSGGLEVDNDARFYTDGDNRYWGGTEGQRSAEPSNVYFHPLERLMVKTIQCPSVTNENLDSIAKSTKRITTHLVVATFAAYLREKDQLSKEEALIAAEKAARCLSEKFICYHSFSNPYEIRLFFGDEIAKEVSGIEQIIKFEIPGLRINIPKEFPTVSAIKVIGGDRETLDKLINSVVIIGGTFTGNMDSHDYLFNGEKQYGVYAIASSVKELINEWENVKESDCFKNQDSKSQDRQINFGNIDYRDMAGKVRKFNIFGHLILAAKNGDAQAQFEVGRMYYRGEGVLKNLEKAFSYLKLAADNGYVPAQAFVGYMYSEGEGVLKDNFKAFQYTLKAAEQGSIVSQLNIGKIYYLGTGVKKDYVEALNWYKLAADNGDAEAQFRAGAMYYLGEGVTKNYDEAFKYFKLAADQGIAAAQSDLGNMYFWGQGVEEDLNMAFHYFMKAAEQNLPAAQDALGNLYFKGKGVSQDFQKALNWYDLAAKQGFTEAQFNIGNMYLNGNGVPKDSEKAIEYFRLAADHGHLNAIEKLKELK